MKPPIRMLTQDEGELLLTIARSAIANDLGVKQRMPSHSAEPALRQTGASFVTLTKDGKVRGRCGTLHVYRELAADVAENARTAAFSDPRHPAVREDELEQLRVEVAHLSAPLLLEYDGTERGAISALRPGVDGLALSIGRHHSVLLPDAWQDHPEPADFLNQLKRKAQLDARFWDDRIQLSRYEARIWREP